MFEYRNECLSFYFCVRACICYASAAHRLLGSVLFGNARIVNDKYIQKRKKKTKTYRKNYASRERNPFFWFFAVIEQSIRSNKNTRSAQIEYEKQRRWWAKQKRKEKTNERIVFSAMRENSLLSLLWLQLPTEEKSL